MAGSQKEFELLFKLKATLGGDFKNTFKQAIDTQKQLQNSLKNVNSLQSKIDGYNKQSAAIDKNKEKLEALNKEHDRLQQELNESGEPTEALRRKLEKNESQIQQTTAKIEEQKQELEKLSGELKEAGVNTDNLTGENDRLQKSYDKLKSSQETLRQLDAKQQQISQSIGQTKTQLLGTVGVMTAVAAAVYAGPIKTYQDFEAEMSTVAGITHATGDELEALKNAAKQAGQTTWATATESAQALEYMSLAGWTSEQSIGALNDMLMAAKISGLDLGASTDLVTDSMSAMGLSVDQLGHYLDVTTKANNVANTTSSDLMEAILGCAGAAKTNGISLESLSTALSVFANNGLKGTQAGTAMNSILVRMTSNDKALTEMARLGVSAFDEQTGSFRDMGDILKDLEAKMVTMTDAERDASLKAIAGTNYYSQFAYLLDSVSEAAEGTAGSWDVLTDKLNNADGAAGEMYDTMMNNLSGAMTEAKSAIEAVQLALGEALTPALTDAVRAVTPYIQKVATFISDHKELVATVAKVVAVLAAARVGFLGLKLAGLTGESGIISIMQKLVGLRAGMIENAATSVSFATKLSGAGKGLLSYFGNVGSALGGVGTAIGKVFSGNALTGKVGAFLGGIRTQILGGISGLAGKAAGALTGAGSKMLGFILTPFRAIGGRLGGLLSGVGSVIANSPIGRIGSFITGGISKAVGGIGSLFAPIGNAVKTILGPIGNLAKTALGPLGGIAGKVLPIVGIVTAVITVFKMLKDHLQEVRDFIQRTFGDEALAVFDKIVAVITNVGETIKGIFSDGNIGAARDKIQEIFGDKGATVFDKLVGILRNVISVVQSIVNFLMANVVPVMEQIFTVIITQIVPGIISFVQAAAPVIMDIVGQIVDFIAALMPVIADAIAALMPIISDIITFISTYVLPIISEVFTFITSTVLPIISQMIQALLPVIQNVLTTLIPAIQTAVTTIWNVVQPIIAGILAAVQAAMPTIQAVVTTVVTAIGGVINGLATVLNGIITFITGVFTGNWSQAWEGIKSIFSGAFEAIKSIAKGVMNGIIDIINGAIGGLNKLQIPDWVPGVGGKGINIPLIPKLAKGSTYTPDTFIAGEAGPELITNAPGRTVFTASQTKDIMAAQGAAAAAVQAAPTVQGAAAMASTVNAAPIVAAGAGNGGSGSSAGGTNNVTINNNPTIVVNGDQPDDLEEKLEENNQRLLRQVENMLDDKADKEERQKYD